MAIEKSGILDFIDVFYYALALPLSIYILSRHGFASGQAWAYLLVLAIIRIVGAVTGLIAMNHHDVTLTEISTICFSVGITPLLLSMLSLIRRIHTAIQPTFRSKVLLRIYNLPILAGLILAILGGTKLFSSDQSQVQIGMNYVKVASCIFAVMLGVLTMSTLGLLTWREGLSVIERRLLNAIIISIPFFAARVTYAVLLAFHVEPKFFNTTSNATEAIVVEAFMSVATELAVVTIYLIAGWSTIGGQYAPVAMKSSFV